MADIRIYNIESLGKPLGQYSHVTRVKAGEYLLAVREVCEGVAATFGATAEVLLRLGVDATVNAPRPTAVMHEAAAAVLGADKIDTAYRTTGGEDFSAVLARVPGNFFFIGARSGERTGNPHHNPHFDIDEACLPQGVAILCDAALRCLNGAHE